MMTFTKEEAAERLGMSMRSLERRMNKGEIGYYRLTSRPTFGEQHIEEYERAHEVKPRRKRRTT